MKNASFEAWPVDEGQMGIRLDIETDSKAALPPCPGLGGWKAAGHGSWWTRIKGKQAEDLAAILSSSEDGWYQPVIVTVAGNQFTFDLSPA